LDPASRPGKWPDIDFPTVPTHRIT
jgi:hypothetical protein